MPIYTYKCQNCNHAFEEILSTYHGAERIEKPCPKCKKITLIRPIVAPVVHMKGYTANDARYKRGMKK